MGRVARQACRSAACLAYYLLSSQLHTKSEMAALETDATRSDGPLRVGLLGPYFSRNLGDTAIQMAVIENLRARIPTLKIVGICPDPKDTVRSLGIAAFPLDGSGPSITSADLDEPVQTQRQVAGMGERVLAWWRAPIRIADLVRSLDLLIVSGGGQLDDFWGGAWSHPFAMFIWSALARLCGVRVAFVGVGMDRLSNPLSRFFALSALRLAHYRAFRDAGTLAALKSLGLRASSLLCPDLAFSLALNEPSGSSSSNSDPYVAVNPISAKTWAHGGDDRHDVYLRHLAAACEWSAEQGLRVRIVCSQGKMDRPTAVRLAEMIQPRFSGRVELRDAPRVPDFLAEVRGAQIVIASRLHGAILSLVAGVPVVAISPLPKVAQLLIDVGLSDYCVELQNFTDTDLIERIRVALDRQSDLQRHVRERTQVFRIGLRRTYDDVLALVDFPTVSSRVKRPAHTN